MSTSNPLKTDMAWSAPARHPLHLMDYPIRTAEKLRFADTDSNGHISNAVFAVCCQNARMELLHDPRRRANGALNLLHIGSAFAVQIGVGFIVDLWPAEQGRHPVTAFQTALGINLALQAAAFLWFVRPTRRAVFAKILPAHPIHALATTLGVPAAVAIPYLQARQEWWSRQVIAQRQVSAWRSAALVSAVIMAAIGSTLLLPASTATTTWDAQLTSYERRAVVAAQILPTNLLDHLLPTSSQASGHSWNRRGAP